MKLDFAIFDKLTLQYLTYKLYICMLNNIVMKNSKKMSKSRPAAFFYCQNMRRRVFSHLRKYLFIFHTFFFPSGGKANGKKQAKLTSRRKNRLLPFPWPFFLLNFFFLFVQCVLLLSSSSLCFFKMNKKYKFVKNDMNYCRFFFLISHFSPNIFFHSPI